MKRQSTSKLLRLMVAVFALFLLVMAGSVLSACGGEVTEQPNNAEVHKHTYGQPEHTAIAKCGSTGYDVYTCTECGDKYAIVTAATGAHDFKNGVCEVCGLKLPAEYVAYSDKEVKDLITQGDSDLAKTLAEILKKVNAMADTISTVDDVHKHNFVEDEELGVDPSCLSAGVKVGKCAECNSVTVLEWYAPTQHKYVAVEAGKKAATCTTPGQILMQCTVCHDEYMAVNEAEPATGHKFERTSEEMKLDKPANCITPKLLAYKCSVCNAIEYQQLDNELNSKRHSDSEKAEDVDGFIKDWNEWGTPATSDAVTPPSMLPDGVVPSSTLKVYWAQCPACNEIVWKTERIKCEHTWTACKDNVAATCEGDGLFNAVCTKCGQYANQLPTGAGRTENFEFANAEAIGERIEDKFVVDPRLGHDYTDEDLEDFYEVDRMPGSNDIVTDSQSGKISANTTCWKGTVCKRCEHRIVVGSIGEGEEKKVFTLDINDYDAAKTEKIVTYASSKVEEQCRRAFIEEILAYNPGVTEEQLLKDPETRRLIQSYVEVRSPAVTKVLFPREWHTWTLYNPEVGTDGKVAAKDKNIKLESGITLVPPEDADAPRYETCITGGRYWYYCIDTDCTRLEDKDSGVTGRWIFVDHDPMKHNWVLDEDNDNNKAPTCTSSGVAVFKCANELAKINPDGTRDTEHPWKCGAMITVSIDEDKEDEITSPEHFWEAMHRTLEGGKSVWTDEYLGYWNKLGVLKIEPATKDGKEDPNAGSEEVIYYDAIASEQLYLLVTTVMPQAHLWVKDAKATAALNGGRRTCYDGGATIYKCECKLDSGNCCVDATLGGSKKCPTWTAIGGPAHMTNDEEEHEFGTYIIYGKEYSERADRFNIEVTYCKFCGLEISRRVLDDRNYQSFPFDRIMIESLIKGRVPEYTETTEGNGVITRDYTSPEKFMSEEMIEKRLTYANIWISIQRYWYEDSKDSKYEANLFDYLYTKGNPKGDKKFTVFCFDCKHPVFDYTLEEMHEGCEELEFEDTDKKIYAYDPVENVYVEITPETIQTYSSCEYVYYEQYEKACETCGNIFRFAAKDEDDNMSGYNGYTRLSVDAKGEYLTPTGTHYLVPAYRYWAHDNFKVNSDKSVTMDWVCALCGKFVERTVALETLEAEEIDSEPVKQLIDLGADEHYILLVGLDGVILDSELNQRDPSMMEKAPAFEINDLVYFGTDCSSDKATWEYKVGMTYVLKEENGKLVSYVKGSDNKAVEVKSRKASYLRYNHFVDVNTITGKREYEEFWTKHFGEKADPDGARLKELFKEGGEIVLGADVELEEERNITIDTTIDLAGHNLKANFTLNTRDADLTIDGKGFEIKSTGAKGDDIYGTVTGKFKVMAHGDLTVKNANITNESGNGIVFVPVKNATPCETDSVVTLENVMVYSKNAAVVSNGLSDGGKLIMNNCTLITDNATATCTNALWIAGDTRVEATNCVFYSQWEPVFIAGGDVTFTKCTFIAGNKKDTGTGWTTDGNHTPLKAEAAIVIVAKGGNYGPTVKVAMKGDCKILLAKDDILVQETEHVRPAQGMQKIGRSNRYYTPNDAGKTNKKALLSVNAWRDGSVTLTLDKEIAEDTTGLNITNETSAAKYCGVWTGSTAEKPITIIVKGATDIEKDKTYNITSANAALTKS